MERCFPCTGRVSGLQRGRSAARSVELLFVVSMAADAHGSGTVTRASSFRLPCDSRASSAFMHSVQNPVDNCCRPTILNVTGDTSTLSHVLERMSVEPQICWTRRSEALS